MPYSIELGPLWDASSALMGFLSGGLMSAGIFAAYGIFVQSLLFLLGFLIFLDSVIPRGEDVYIATTFIFLVIGAAVSLALSILRIELLFVIAVFLLAIMVYFVRLARHLIG